jgi:hypothetical protein
MLDFLTNLFSGGQQRGYQRAGETIGQGMGEMRQNTDKANSFLQPHANMNQQQLQDFINSYQKMANPKDYFNKTMEGYEETPWAKTMTKRGIDQAEAAAGRSGTLGSTGLSNQISQHASDTSKMDMQQFFNNIMGINQQKMGNQAQAIGFTNNAPYQQSKNMMGLSQMLSEMFGGQAKANLGEERGKSKGLGSMISGLMGMF